VIFLRKEAAVSYRSSFTDEEWRTLQFTILWIFTAVAGVDKEIDSQEMGALAREISEASRYKNPLAREVLTSIRAEYNQVFQTFHEDDRGVLQGLKQAGDLLCDKVDAVNADHFRRAVLLIGSNIVQASCSHQEFKTGKEEKAALALVSIALGLEV
jgi:hypothetical protein